MQKEKEKKCLRRNHSTFHTLNTNSILNIYNLLNNIKFTKEKKNFEKKKYPVLDFWKVKYYTKRKRKKNDKDKLLNIPHSKY